MNLKNLSLGLTLTGLAFVALTPKAQAFQFSYLNQVANPGGGFDFNFELQSNPFDYIYSGENLTVKGFQGVREASLTAPQTNKTGVISADTVFDPDQVFWNKTTARFTTSDFIYSSRPLSFQTFTITAASVDNNIVNANFGGQQLPPTPVPEPLTILGSMAALGFASRCQKEFAKKQSANSEEA